MENDKRDFLYCNQVQIATSPWDIVFSFQRIGLGLQKNGQANLEANSICDQIQVAMSPTHAKIFIALLYDQISQYEKNINAKIPLDKDYQATYDSFMEKIKSSS